MRLCPAFLAFVVLSVFPKAVNAQPCPVPAQYSHLAVQVEEIVRVTLGTALDTYSVGDSIACYLMFENIGDSTYVIPNPSSITPFHSFWILPDTCDSLMQGGCTEALQFFFPEVVFFFGLPVFLEPGECVSYEVTWDGVPRYVGGVTPPGNYVVFGGMTTGGRIFFPDGGIKLLITIQDPVLRWPSTWGQIKARYGN